ncbi:MAG: 50S ribosomal protein L25 [Candidatus Krumholzibacteriota bacterium]|nr:50S ribosomal protein L25 [Candidatus Krumholzibacteriota bacterium]
MEKILLKSTVREEVGKKSGGRLRRNGKIPGILYGHKEEPIPLAIDEHDIWEILHNAQTENLIVHLDIEGVDLPENVTIVRDIQQHPVTGDILHVDLLRVAMDEMIDVNVPVRIKGVAKGVTEEGGILYHSIRQIRINSNPSEIPEFINVDVTEMSIGDTIHVSDIVGDYEDINFVSELDLTLVHVAAPKELELPEEEVEEEGLAEGEEVEEGEEEETEGEEEQDEEGS